MRSAAKKAKALKAINYAFGVYQNGQHGRGLSYISIDRAIIGAVRKALKMRAERQHRKGGFLLQVCNRRTGRVHAEVRSGPRGQVTYVNHIK